VIVYQQALTPEVIEVDGDPVVKRFFVDTISYNPTSCKVHVRFDGDELVVVAGDPLTDVYAEDGKLLGPLSYLAQDTVGLDVVRRHLMFEAHKHPEKDQVKAFSITLAMPQLGYYLQRSDTGELHLIEELEIWGDFAVSQTEVPLTLAKLGGRVYGAAEASIAGRPAVWVGTTDRRAQTTTISWQTTDAQGPPQPPVPVRPIHFPGLLGLFPAPVPTRMNDEVMPAPSDEPKA